MAKKKSTAIVVADESALTRPDLLATLAALPTDPVALGLLRESARLAKKELDTARAAEKKQHLDAGRAVDAKYRAGIETCDRVVQACTEALEAGLAAQRAETARVLADNTAPLEQRVAALVSTAVVVPSTVRVKLEYSFEVENLDEVPRQFLTVDADALQKHIEETHGQAPVGGIKILRKEKVVTR